MFESHNGVCSLRFLLFFVCFFQKHSFMSEIYIFVSTYTIAWSAPLAWDQIDISLSSFSDSNKQWVTRFWRSTLLFDISGVEISRGWGEQHFPTKMVKPETRFSVPMEILTWWNKCLKMIFAEISWCCLVNFRNTTKMERCMYILPKLRTLFSYWSPGKSFNFYPWVHKASIMYFTPCTQFFNWDF